MLISKKTDCYINDRQAILLSWEKLKKIDQFKNKKIQLIEGAEISKENGHIGYTNRDKGRFRFKEHFVKTFDTSLEKLKKSGELQKTIKKFWESLKK